MLTTLLSPETHPLHRLTLSRIQLDATSPVTSLETHGDEVLLYSLVGRADVYCNGRFLGSFGNRKQVTERLVHAIRFPMGTEFTVALTVNGAAADILCLTATPPVHGNSLVNPHPYLHWNDTVWNEVGEGCHFRHVAEVPTPEGFAIYTGETLNIPGGTSSWPPHANPEDLRRFAAKETTWEEVMFFSCKEPGIVDLQGIYTGGKIVNELVRIENGSAQVMPLGSHRIVAAPDSYIWYHWSYCGTALQKQYRKFASDTNIYVK